MSGPAGPAPLVHGLGRELVAPDWAPIAAQEAGALLTRFGWPPTPRASVVWHSPRALSAAAIVQAGGARALVKRHDPRVRTAATLALEHRFAAHLSRRGVPAIRALATPGGATVVTTGGAVYELQAVADGVDLYRDAASWTGYRSPAHAHAAGAALARLHRAADGFPAPARPLGPLGDWCAFAAARDPVAAIAAYAGSRPGLAASLRPWPWSRQLTAALGSGALGSGALGSGATAAAVALAALPRCWGHGDWHPSNLTWSHDGPDATVAGVLDLGLANRTTPAWDLAIAIERACIDWLALEQAGGRAGADLAALDALLAGYETQRPLHQAEADALAALLPVVHVAFALSEIEYYSGVLRSPQRAQVAYRDYLIGHCRWFRSPDGAALLEHLRARAQPRRSREPTPRR